MVTTIFSIVTPAVSQFVLCIGALVFYLVYQQRLRSAVVYLLNDHEARLATLRTLTDIDEQMTTYFGTFTIVNVCLGLVTVVLTWAVGLPNPLLWGVLAGVLNYVPYLRAGDCHGHAGRRWIADVPDARRGGRGAGDLPGIVSDRGPVSHACPDGTAARAQSVRGLPGHRLLHVAVGACRRLRGGAPADRAHGHARPCARGGQTRSAGLNLSERAALSRH